MVLLTSIKSEFPDLAILSVHCEIIMYCLFQIVILMVKILNNQVQNLFLPVGSLQVSDSPTPSPSPLY